MEKSEDSTMTSEEAGIFLSCNESEVVRGLQTDADVTNKAFINDAVKKPDNNEQIFEKSFQNSSIKIENNEVCTKSTLDESDSEQRETVNRNLNSSTIDANFQTVDSVNKVGLLRGVEEEVKGSVALEEVSCGKEHIEATDICMLEDKNSLPVKFSESSPESSEDEASESVPVSFFGIELDSANKEHESSPSKHLSNEMDVNYDQSVDASSDEVIVIDSKLSEGDSLSLHRGAVVPYSDSDSDSDSSSDSCESSSDESSESDDSSESETEDKGEKVKSTVTVKTKKVPGEFDLDDLPPIQDLHISVRNDQVVEIGKVLHAVDTLVVVEGYKDQPPLDIESVLFLDRGSRPLGRIFDVMGPVKEPLYCVRFNSKEHIEEQNIKPGMLVYCAPQTEHSNFIFLQHLLMMKGSDASWKKDREIPVQCLDFSDDEEEARMKKTDNRPKAVNSKSLGEPSPKAARTNKQQSSGCTVPSTSDHPGRVFRPRNPWGWPGAQHSNSWNQQHHQRQPRPPPPPPHSANSYRAMGHVRPPSFNVESQFQNQPSFRNFDSGTNRYPSYPQFGREPDPSMFNNQLPTPGYNPSWPSSERTHHIPNQGNSFCPRPSAHPWQPPAPYVHNPPHDQRYQAFQSEIARLMDAYNRGAESPMAVPPPMRPPAPQWNSSMSNDSYYPG